MLQSGQYVFKSLRVEPDAKLNWDTDGFDSMSVQVMGPLYVGDRAIVKGDRLISFTALGSVEIGCDTWTHADFFSPGSSIRVASRAQLNGRLLAKNIRLEPDVGAYGVPAIRMNSTVESLLLNTPDTLTFSEFAHITMLMENPENIRKGEMSYLQKMSHLNNLLQISDSGYVIPLMTLHKKFAVQSSGQRKTYEVSASTFYVNELVDGERIGLYAPIEIQDVDDDYIMHWEIKYGNLTYTIKPDSILWITTPPAGEYTIEIKAYLESGKVIDNYYAIEVKASLELNVPEGAEKE